ncbi:MAG: GtrA family protein [Christensenella sp.]|uniref:GtrA family protein n=1 Tax=Christensenella sp. TaxID=1935934 RepID=UPI002B21833E|nr:GtrA family protein [Christensenella sp.]MEA5002434.1 GtrA family protein [Christensenella sp.]
MDTNKITVLLTGADETLLQQLTQAGFHVLRERPDMTVRAFFTQALEQSDASIFVRADASEGFDTDDITNVAQAALSDPQKVYVGAREQTVKKSLAQNIYGFLSGIEAQDVCSSLFAMSRENLELMTHMKSKDKAFCSNILLEAREKNLVIVDIPTQAKIDVAPGWDLLTSSFKLYLVFIKFSIAAFIAYLVDIGTFYLFQKLFSFLDDEFKILTATVISRILCSIATYLLNRGAVFNSQARSRGTVVRFVILAVGQLIVSWLLVWGIGSLLGGGDEVNTLLKVVVDLVIFIASFSIQRDWVFKESKGLLK